MNTTITDHAVRIVDYNTADSADEENRPAALDAAHIRLHLCAHAGYPTGEVNEAIRDAREQGWLIERRDGYVVAGGRGEEGGP